MTDTTKFVLTARNKDNSKFYARPKSDLIKEQENNTLVISTVEGVFSKKEIIAQIENGIQFFTHINKIFTEVIVVDGNLKTVANETTEDNIEKLLLIN